MIRFITIFLIIITFFIGYGIAGGESIIQEKTEYTGLRNSQNRPNLPFVSNDKIQKINLDELIAYALKNNPKVAAAKARWEASLNGEKIAASLPDPMIGVTYFINKISTRNGSLMGGVNFGQKFPWIGKLGTKSQIRKSMSGVLETNLEAVRAKIVSNIKKVYYELYFIRKAKQVTNTNIILLKQLENVAQIKYVSGKVTQQDVLKIQVEISKLLDDLITLKDENNVFAIKMNTLLGKDINEIVGETEELEFKEYMINLESLYSTLKQKSPELKIKKEQINKSNLDWKFSKLERFPDFNLGYHYQWIDDDAVALQKGKDAQSITFSMNLPIWFGKQNARIDEAKLNVLDKELTYEDTENRLLSDLKNKYYRLIVAQRKIKLYNESILPRMEQALKVTIEGYEGGKAGFLDLIDSQKNLLFYKLELARSVKNYFSEVSTIEELFGGSISLNN